MLTVLCRCCGVARALMRDTSVGCRRGEAAGRSDRERWVSTPTAPLGGRVRSLLLPGILASCVAGSEGPHDSGSSTGPEPGLTADLFAGPIEVPDHIAVDSVLEMDIAVRNGGTGVVNAGWVLRVVLSTDKLIDSADIQIDHFAAPRILQPGAEDHYLRHKKLRASTPTGLYYVGSILDVTGAVSEGSETNNTLQSPTPITLTAKDAGPSVGDD